MRIRCERTALHILATTLIGTAWGCSAPTSPAPASSSNATPVATALASIRPAPRTTGVQAVWSDLLVSAIGVNTHLTYDGTPYVTAFSTMVLANLQAAGIRHIRDGYASTGGDWSANPDILGAAGILSDVVMVYPWGGATSATQWLAGILTFVKSAYIEAIEGYNEPNLAQPSTTWASLTLSGQQKLFSGVTGSRTTSRIPVIAPSLGYLSPSQITAAAKDINGISRYVDYANAHPYSSGQLPATNFATCVNAISPYEGRKSMWFTEVGYYTTPDGVQGVSLAAQAKYDIRLILEAWLIGVTRSYIYSLIDDQSGVAQEDQGLITTDGTLKPSFTTIQNFIGLLADPGSTYSPGKLGYSLPAGTPTTIHQLLLENRKGTFFLLLWQEVLSYNTSAEADIVVAPVNVTVTFTSTHATVNQYEPYIQSGTVGTASNVASVTVAVPDHPLILQITG